MGDKDMQRLCLLTLIFWGTAFMACVYGFEDDNTTLKNNDANRYEYIMKTACGRMIPYDEKTENKQVIYDCVIGFGEIDAHARLAICKYGCELTLADTGQTITVEQGDAVVIDKGVLKVQ
jgi:hypothetical protein